MHRRAFLKTTGLALTAAVSRPRAWAEEESKERDSELLNGAARRIAEHRQGPIRVMVKSASGQPLPGVRVTAEQRRHDFLFGCNFFMFGRCGDEPAEEQYRKQFVDVFNYCTLGFYWAAYEREQGRPDYDYTDQVLDWTRARRVLCKGHPLVWDHPASSPRWLPSDAKEIERLSQARVREIVERFRGRLDVWDVVNEAAHLPDKVNKTQMARWALEYGPVPYVVNHLQQARKANPSATLLVNDYRTDRPYLELLSQVRARGENLFDAVGIQSHMHDGAWRTGKTWEVCERYAALGLPLHFTEATLVSGPRLGPGENWGGTEPALEERQADGTEEFYRLLFSHPKVDAITWWDFSDRGAWQGAAAGWVRKDMSPKPVYRRMHDLIKREWWTRARAETDVTGQAALRGYYGSYAISAELPNGEVARRELRLRPGAANTVEILL